MSIEAAGQFVIVETPDSQACCLPPDRRPNRGTVVSVGPGVATRVAAGDAVVFEDSDSYEVGDGFVAFHESYLLGIERDSMREEVLALVGQEREYQDRKWGGAKSDDTQTEADWQNYIKEYSRGEGRAEGLDFKTRMVKTAALAVAAAESDCRKARGQ